MDNNFDVIFFIHPKGCLKWTIIIVCIISDVIGAILAATDIGVGECIAKQVHALYNNYRIQPNLSLRANE